LSKPIKTKLPYLLQEALETGGWKIDSVGANSETWTRPDQQVTLGHRLLNGTTPPSVVFQLTTLDGPEHGLEVINSLCMKLAKRNT
tara:strand:- start:370 stop:627 length:258 start_codon:yes stop_codon:yes gene_type:complete